MSQGRRTETVPGAQADRPSQVPKKGWLQIAKRAWAEAKADQVPLLSAGVAFYAFLSIFPALIAAVTLYGLVADPQQPCRRRLAACSSTRSSHSRARSHRGWGWRPWRPSPSRCGARPTASAT
jgi:hypothetical protein